MKHIAFDRRFVNAAGDGLVEGKIHTIRSNYFYWKQFEGQDLALFTWNGKPYQKGSRQKVFCVKKLISVQRVIKSGIANFFLSPDSTNPIPKDLITKNDGFNERSEFRDWFIKGEYPDYSEQMAILHFTDFKY